MPFNPTLRKKKRTPCCSSYPGKGRVSSPQYSLAKERDSSSHDKRGKEKEGAVGDLYSIKRHGKKKRGRKFLYRVRRGEGEGKEDVTLRFHLRESWSSLNGGGRKGRRLAAHGRESRPLLTGKTESRNRNVLLDRGGEGTATIFSKKRNCDYSAGKRETQRTN